MEIDVRHLGHVECVRFEVPDNTGQSDAALFRAAADWLESYPNKCLMGASFRHGLDGIPDATSVAKGEFAERSTLFLYLDEVPGTGSLN